jgi:hypothetical protein
VRGTGPAGASPEDSRHVEEAGIAPRLFMLSESFTQNGQGEITQPLSPLTYCTIASYKSGGYGMALADITTENSI